MKLSEETRESGNVTYLIYLDENGCLVYTQEHFTLLRNRYPQQAFEVALSHSLIVMTIDGDDICRWYQPLAHV